MGNVKENMNLIQYLAVAQSSLTLCDPIALPTPVSMEFSRPESWSGLPCPPPGDLPDPGIEPVSPALRADSLSLSHCCC